MPFLTLRDGHRMRSRKEISSNPQLCLVMLRSSSRIARNSITITLTRTLNITYVQEWFAALETLGPETLECQPVREGETGLDFGLDLALAL